MAEVLMNPDSQVSEDLAREVEALSAIFVGEGEFHVEEMPAGNDYCCMVKLQPRGLPVGLQFSLPASYPETSPRLEILPREGASTDALRGDDPLLTELLQVLYQSAQGCAGEPVMYTLVDVAREWLDGRTVGQDNNDDDDDDDDGNGNDQEEEASGATSQQSAHRSNKSPAKLEDDRVDGCQGRGAKKKKKKKTPDEEQDPGKKPRMKTASEVISRIQWDKQLRQADFAVGYLDRFLGVVEKPFTAFSWVDIATVDDYTTLAIPRHRIQYFKYKDQVVWDKSERLDDVFGSTGSKKTILDTVRMFSKENQSVEEKEASEEVGEEESAESNQSTSFNAGGLPQRAQKQQPSRGANYFFAIRLTDPVIVRCARRIQDAICDEDPRLGDKCIDPSRLHLTLCTIRLDNTHHMAKAVDVLESLREGISDLLAPVTMLRFHGLGQFHNRILYAVPERNTALERMAEILQAGLSDAGVNLVGNHPEFNPHMTLIKLQRTAADEFDDPPIHPGLYERFAQAFIGVQAVDAIHLCSMKDEARADGFYYCLASMNVQSEH